MVAIHHFIKTTPLGLEPCCTWVPGLLEDSRTLGWKKEHLWRSRIESVGKEQCVALGGSVEPLRGKGASFLTPQLNSVLRVNRHLYLVGKLQSDFLNMPLACRPCFKDPVVPRAHNDRTGAVFRPQLEAGQLAVFLGGAFQLIEEGFFGYLFFLFE